MYSRIMDHSTVGTIEQWKTIVRQWDNGQNNGNNGKHCPKDKGQGRVQTEKPKEGQEGRLGVWEDGM